MSLFLVDSTNLCISLSFSCRFHCNLIIGDNNTRVLFVASNEIIHLMASKINVYIKRYIKGARFLIEVKSTYELYYLCLFI